jgi:regulator of protease activity HflC (stomatin/prohibitin superfamily)
VDEALTRDQSGFRETARLRLEQSASELDLGITEIQIDNMQLIPPRQLKDAFARVSEAEVVRSKELNEARSYENQTISKARAEAEARKNAGEAERTRLVEFVAAEVDRFTNNLPAYRSNRELFVEQRRAETLQVVYAAAQEKIVLFKGPGTTNLSIWLQINRDLPRLKEKEPDKPKDAH